MTTPSTPPSRRGWEEEFKKDHAILFTKYTNWSTVNVTTGKTQQLTIGEIVVSSIRSLLLANNQRLVEGVEWSKLKKVFEDEMGFDLNENYYERSTLEKKRVIYGLLAAVKALIEKQGV